MSMEGKMLEENNRRDKETAPTIEHALEFIKGNTFPFGDLHSTAELMVKFAAECTAQAPTQLELEQEEDGRWIAEFGRFPGVVAYGATEDEAIYNAAKVLLGAAPPAVEKMPTLEEWMSQVYPDANLDKLEIPARVCIEIAKSYARAKATPQGTPWKSSFTDSDVTGNTHNYVDTGDGKRLWAEDADEIVKRHNAPQGTPDTQWIKPKFPATTPEEWREFGKTLVTPAEQKEK